MFSLFIYRKRKPIFILALVLFCLFGVFGVARPTHAFWGLLAGGAAAAMAVFGLGDVVGSILDKAGGLFVFLFGRLLQGLIDWLGQLFISVTDQLVKVAQYNNFLGSQAVQTGWVVVRDVGNMFFVVILLVIAIATILHVESYNYKKALPKLLLMAVLINFSKTICGIIIDFSQVIMLTFVNAWKAAAGANFVMAFGIDKVYEIAQSEAAGNDAAIIGSLLLGLTVVLIALATVSVMLVILIARIIALWILIILSPLAFLGASFPQGKPVADKWRDYFTKYVITGPMLAFFIWLALIVAGGGTGNEQVGVVGGNSTVLSPSVGVSALGTMEKLSSVIVATSMFLIGLMVASQMGVAGSSLAGSVLNTAKRAGTAPFRAARRAGSWGWKKAKGAAGSAAGTVSDFTYAKTGVALPFSARRKEAAEKRRKNISSMREAEGMARTAQRMAGGRAFLASVIDPRAASKMSRWEMAKATLGSEEAQDRVRRAAGGMASSAADDMRAVDKLQGERLQQGTEKEMAERRLKKVEGSKEFQDMKATRVGDLTAAVAAQQNDVQTRQAEADTLAQAAKFHKLLSRPVATADDDIRDAVADDRAQTDLKTEKERRKNLGMSDMSQSDEQAFLNNSRAVHRAAVDPAVERNNMTNMLNVSGLAAFAPTEDQVKSAQSELTKAKEKLDAATHSLETYRDRENNPKPARADALKRREAARERGDDAEVKKINLELDELDAKIKISDVNNFFKMSYNEQVNVAKKNADGLSESKLTKDIAAALREGDISTSDQKEVMKLWAEKDFKAAKERFEEIQKKNKEAKKTT